MVLCYGLIVTFLFIIIVFYHIDLLLLGVLCLKNRLTIISSPLIYVLLTALIILVAFLNISEFSFQKISYHSNILLHIHVVLWTKVHLLLCSFVTAIISLTNYFILIHNFNYAASSKNLVLWFTCITVVFFFILFIVAILFYKLLI